MRAGTAVALALLLAGCSGGSTGPTANPNARSAEPASDRPAPSSFAPRSLAPASPPSASASARDERILVTDYTVFESPTGNILCGITGRESNDVRCDIGERDWEPPPRPAECEFDYGTGTELDDSGAAITCASDAVGEPELTLEYGERIQGGDILCTSTESGMTCTHQGTGHGFRLARAEYELF